LGDELNITNDWDSVFDSGISAGTTNWQLVGSCKPNHEAYSLTAIYNATYDAMDEQFSCVFQNPTTFDISKNIYKLSARYPHHYEPFMRSEFAKEYNSKIGNASSNGGAAQSKKQICNNLP
jgi:hypothetical protein